MAIRAPYGAKNGNDGDHLQDNFDNNSEYGHQQYDQEKDVEPG